MANYYPSKQWLARNVAYEEVNRLGHADLLRYNNAWYDSPTVGSLYTASAEHVATHLDQAQGHSVTAKRADRIIKHRAKRREEWAGRVRRTSAE